MAKANPERAGLVARLAKAIRPKRKTRNRKIQQARLAKATHLLVNHEAVVEKVKQQQRTPPVDQPASKAAGAVKVDLDAVLLPRLEHRNKLLSVAAGVCLRARKSHSS